MNIDLSLNEKLEIIDAINYIYQNEKDSLDLMQTIDFHKNIQIIKQNPSINFDVSVFEFISEWLSKGFHDDKAYLMFKNTVQDQTTNIMFSWVDRVSDIIRISE